MSRASLSAAVRSALATALCLPGGLVAGFGAGAIVFEGLPGHMPDGVKTVVAAALALVVLTGSGAAWGRIMAAITGSERRKRMAIAGALGYGVAVLGAGSGLTALEVAIVQNGGGPDLPIHVVFTFLFTPAAAIVGAIGGLALGAATLGARPAARTAALAGLAAGLAFLAVDLVLDTLGFRVGAPGAAERATMLTVAFSGALAASLAGGAVIGIVLGRQVSAAMPPSNG